MDKFLMVIEGVDGSGKSTQFDLLAQALKDKGIELCTARFPRYDNQSAALLKMYLDGEFGTKPEDVNAYAASTFYAVDRYAAYKTQWGKDYESGVPILCDRYTTSNAVHQAVKLPREQTEPFLNWLFDYEYRLLGLPKPKIVLFLDMPTELSLKLIEKRQGDTGDIHERDPQYLAHCRERALDLCDREGWRVVHCAKDGALRTQMDIHEEILSVVLPLLNK